MTILITVTLKGESLLSRKDADDNDAKGPIWRVIKWVSSFLKFLYKNATIFWLKKLHLARDSTNYFKHL